MYMFLSELFIDNLRSPYFIKCSYRALYKVKIISIYKSEKDNSKPIISRLTGYHCEKPMGAI